MKYKRIHISARERDDGLFARNYWKFYMYICIYNTIRSTYNPTNGLYNVQK